MGSHPGSSRVVEIGPFHCNAQTGPRLHRNNLIAIDAPQRHAQRRLSRWSASAAKRHFDVGCVLLSLPLILPLLVLVAIAVRLTSPGPVLFRQGRMGRDGRPFTIFKFRSIRTAGKGAGHSTITTLLNQPFTPLGPFLRHWKLDELPQVFNVLAGDMSLVGPRPRVLRTEPHPLACRPGITGRATLAFAQEESVLSRVPVRELDFYYDSVVLPVTRRLDDGYMAEATLASDLHIILRSVFRRWDETESGGVLPLAESELLPG